MLSHPFEEQPVTPDQPRVSEQPKTGAWTFTAAQPLPVQQATATHKQGYLATVTGILLPLLVVYLLEKLFLFLFLRHIILNIAFVMGVIALAGVMAAFLIRKWYALIVVPLAALFGELVYMWLEYPDVLKTSFQHFGAWAAQGFPPFNDLLLPTALPALVGVVIGLFIVKRWPGVFRGVKFPRLKGGGL